MADMSVQESQLHAQYEKDMRDLERLQQEALESHPLYELRTAVAKWLSK